MRNLSVNQFDNRARNNKIQIIIQCPTLKVTSYYNTLFKSTIHHHESVQIISDSERYDQSHKRILNPTMISDWKGNLTTDTPPQRHNRKRCDSYSPQRSVRKVTHFSTHHDARGFCEWKWSTSSIATLRAGWQWCALGPLTRTRSSDFEKRQNGSERCTDLSHSYRVYLGNLFWGLRFTKVKVVFSFCIF